MPTKLQHRGLPRFDASFASGSIREAKPIKAAQRELYVLIGVFLGSLTLMVLAVAVSAAIMLANAHQ